MTKSSLGRVPDWREISRERVGEYRVFSVERSIAASPVDGKSHTFHRIASQDWRRRFLHDVASNARTVALADAWAASRGVEVLK